MEYNKLDKDTKAKFNLMVEKINRKPKHLEFFNKLKFIIKLFELQQSHGLPKDIILDELRKDYSEIDFVELKNMYEYLENKHIETGRRSSYKFKL